jgi:hypothetical protein
VVNCLPAAKEKPNEHPNISPEAKAHFRQARTQTPVFLDAKAESVIKEKPEASEASEETALRYLQKFDSKVEKDAALPGKRK